MAVNLSSTSSIIDYLGTQKRDSSFSARKKLYNEMGLNTRLGDYVGSSTQNTNFLNNLRNVSKEDTFLPDETPAKPEPFYPTPSGQLKPPATDAVNTVSQPNATSAVNVASTPTPPPVTPSTPTTATDTMGTLGYTPPPPMTPEALKSTVESDPAYKLAQESQANKTLAETATAEAKKQNLQSKYEGDKTALEQNLASKGLAFSGIRGQDVATLSANLASSTLGVDRELAIKLLESDVNAKEKFLDIAGDVIKNAQDNDKTALDQLNKAGYAVIGGQIMPTTEVLRLTQSAGTADFNKMIQLERLKISAQNAATAEERNSILNQLRAVSLQQKTAVSPGQVVNGATGLPVDLTQGESEMITRQQTVQDYYIPTLQDMLTGIETGAVAGKLNKYTAKMPISQYLRNEELSMFNAMASYMSQQIVYMNSGKQINEAEMKILSQSLPSAELTTAENKARLSQFEKITGQTLDKFMANNGWSIAPSTDVNDIVSQEAGATDDFTEVDDFLNSF